MQNSMEFNNSQYEQASLRDTTIFLDASFIFTGIKGHRNLDIPEFAERIKYLKERCGAPTIAIPDTVRTEISTLLRNDMSSPEVREGRRFLIGDTWNCYRHSLSEDYIFNALAGNVEKIGVRMHTDPRKEKLSPADVDFATNTLNTLKDKNVIAATADKLMIRTIEEASRLLVPFYQKQYGTDRTLQVVRTGDELEQAIENIEIPEIVSPSNPVRSTTRSNDYNWRDLASTKPGFARNYEKKDSDHSKLGIM